MTEFGIFIKILRVKREIKQKDMAKMLGISSAYLSAMEIGRRPVKQDNIRNIINAYQLDGEEIDEIWEAYYNSRFNIRFNIYAVSDKKATLIRLLDREFGNIDDETAEKIIAILKQED